MLKTKKRNAHSIILIFFLTLYIPSFFYWVYSYNTPTDFIRMGRIETAKTADGLIIRDTDVFVSPFDGTYISDFQEGDKIPAGSRIATVYTHDAITHLNELRLKEEMIYDAKKEIANNASFFSTDVRKLENEITEKIQSYVKNNNLNDFTSLYLFRNSINSIIDKKAMILGHKGYANEYISSLENDKASLISKINNNKNDIFSNDTGMISFNIDGYEKLLNFNQISELDIEKYSSFINDAGKAPSLGELVHKDQPFVKVIKGINYYIAICVETYDIINVSEGDNISLRLNFLNKTSSAKVYHKSKNFDGMSIIVLEMNKFMYEMTGRRKANVDIIYNSYEGLTVPLNSLSDYDKDTNTAFIAISEGGFASYIKVVVKGANNDYAVIENMDNQYKKIDLYDSYIINPTNIKDGQAIR